MDRWLQKDISVRVLSVAIALILWFQVMSEENPAIERAFVKVPVSTVSLAQSQVLLDWQPRTVDVTVRGPRNLLSRMSREDIEATVDLSGLSEGHSTLSVDVVVPRGVSVVELVPSIATVVVDTVTDKRVKVIFDVRGTPAEDYEALAPVTQVEEVVATGPRTRLALVEGALGVVDITGASGEMEATSPLVAVGVDMDEVDGVTLEPNEVDVSVPMRQLPPSKVVGVNASVTGTPAEGYRVSSSTVVPGTIKVRASEATLKALGSLTTEPVSVEGREGGVVTQQVGLVLPSGIFSVEPARVTVTVVVGEDRKSRDFDAPVVIKNLSPGLRWQISPSECTISVAGVQAEIDKLTAKQVSAFVDARGLEEGTHTLEVQATLPEGVELTGVNPGTVSVTLTKR